MRIVKVHCIGQDLFIMIGFDKVLHFIAGFLIYCIAHAIGFYINIALSPLVIMFIVLFIGIAKEIFDKFTHGDVEVADVVATVVGGFFGLVVLTSN